MESTTMVRTLVKFAVPLVVAVAASCASNAFVASWQAPDAMPLHVEGARVAAVVMMREEASRRVAEDTLARELSARGALGVPLYTLVDARPENEAEVREALEGTQVAGVVVMRPVGTQTELVTTPGPTLWAAPSYSGFWGGYYGFGWGSPWAFGVAAPPEIRTNTVVSIETLVYSLRQNKLMWVGQSKTTNPARVDRLVTETAAKVARELDRRGLIARAQAGG